MVEPALWDEQALASLHNKVVALDIGKVGELVQVRMFYVDLMSEKFRIFGVKNNKLKVDF